MKIGVVGLGFMGSTHLQAYQHIQQAEIAAVASSDERKLAGDLSAIQGNLAREGQILNLGKAARYRTAEALFADANVEAVDLCVPSYLHAPLAQAALEAGKHVLVEKPMALTAEDCDAMIAAARKHKRVLMVGQVLRFWPDYVAARRLARSGALGAVQAAFFRRKCGPPSWSRWMHEREKSGGGAFDLLIHDFDYCLHLLGKPQSVTAKGLEQIEKGIDVVDAQLEYENGMPVVISGGWCGSSSYPFSMEFSILLEKGTLDFHSELRRLTVYDRDGRAEEPQLEEKDGFQAEIEAFLRACESGEPPEECRPEDSALATRMALAMKTSRERNGEAVAV